MIPQCAQAKPAVTGPHTDHSQAVNSMTVAGVSISPPMPSAHLPLRPEGPYARGSTHY